MEKFLKVLNGICLTILSIMTLASIFVIGYSFYYFKYTNKIVINNISAGDTMYLDPKYGQRFPFEVNMYSNKNNNGIYCYEVLVNTYTNGNLPEPDKYKNVYSAGIQITNEFNSSKHPTYTGFLGLGDVYYHDKIDNAYYYNTDIYADKSYSAVQSLDDFNGFIFNATSGELFTLEPGKDEYLSNGLWITAFQHNDINSFIIDLEKVAYGLEDGEFILQFNLTKYFNWALIGEDNTSDRTDNVSTTIDFTMFNIKINKSSNGLIRAEQSIFKKVNNDKDFSLSGELNDFGNTEFNYYINEFNFNVVNNNNKNNLKLKEDITKFINSFKSVRLIITINLDSNYFNEKAIHGLAENAFNGLPFKSCTITAEDNVKFNLNGNVGNFIFNNVELLEVA